MTSFRKACKLARTKTLTMSDYEAAFRATRLAMMNLLSEQARRNKRHQRPEGEAQVTPDSQDEAEVAPKRSKVQGEAKVTPECPRAQDEAKVAPKTPKAQGEAKVAQKKLKGKREARDHPCMHCPKIFPTGQALGGHQRRHFLEKLRMKMSGIDLKSDTYLKTKKLGNDLKAKLDTDSKAKKLDTDSKAKKLDTDSKAKKLDIDLNKPASFWDMEEPKSEHKDNEDIGETSLNQKNEEATRETSLRGKDEEEKGDKKE